MTMHIKPPLSALEQIVLAEFDRSPLLDGTALVPILANGAALTRKEFSRTRQAGEDALVALQKAGLAARDKRGWWYRLP